jgi:DNA-binding transcriptional regulator YhcF (GntR family)
MSGEADKKPVDWEIVEKDYRAGLKSLRQLADEHGVSHVTIAKRAKKYAWEKNLEEKIQTTAKNKIARTVVNKAGNTEANSKDQLSDAQVVNAYADVVASVDLIQREDLKLAIDNSRSQLKELVALGNPRFVEVLEAIAEEFDESGPTANGGWKTDKVNEMYRYIISLAGRVKMSKEIAAAHGVYIPMQRKVFGLDNEKKSTGEFEEMLRQVQAEA